MTLSELLPIDYTDKTMNWLLTVLELSGRSLSWKEGAEITEHRSSFYSQRYVKNYTYFWKMVCVVDKQHLISISTTHDAGTNSLSDDSLKRVFLKSYIKDITYLSEVPAVKPVDNEITIILDRQIRTPSGVIVPAAYVRPDGSPITIPRHRAGTIVEQAVDHALTAGWLRHAFSVAIPESDKQPVIHITLYPSRRSSYAIDEIPGLLLKHTAQ